MSAELITFGKYKGQPVEVLANDKKYTDWLMAQEWFRTGHVQLYQIKQSTTSIGYDIT